MTEIAMNTVPTNKAPLTFEHIQDVCSQEPLTLFSEREATRVLFIYLESLMKWNKKMNLVGPSYWKDVVDTLIVDSVILAKFLERITPLLSKIEEESPYEIWDLGAGAGLPGIPLRMLWKEGMYTLVEAREKRSLFLKTVLAATSFENTFVYNGRAESFMPTRPLANLVVSRAFMPVEKVLELIQPCMAPQGICVFLTLAPPEELLELSSVWNVCGKEDYQIKGATRWLWAVQYVK